MRPVAAVHMTMVRCQHLTQVRLVMVDDLKMDETLMVDRMMHDRKVDDLKVDETLMINNHLILQSREGGTINGRAKDKTCQGPKSLSANCYYTEWDVRVE